MKISILETILGEAINIGRIDQTSEAAELSKSYVVKNYLQNVGCILGCPVWFWPVWFK